MRTKILTTAFILTLASLAAFSQNNKVKYTVTLDTELCSHHDDFEPSYTDNNGQTIMLTSVRGNQEHRSHIFVAYQKDGHWTRPVRLHINGCDACNYGGSSMDTRRNVIFYTFCSVFKNVQNKCKVYYAFMQGDGVGDQFPVEFEGTSGDSNVYGQPYFSNKTSTLFFVSDRPGGYGSKDIWYSNYDTVKDSWGPPINAGPNVNTEKNEMFPYPADDGSLYFSSDGRGGYGGLDIFKAAKAGRFKWAKAENMGSPINSTEDDFSITFKPGTQSGYFASDRSGGLGAADIYWFEPVK